jgi:hypothetical protein
VPMKIPNHPALIRRPLLAASLVPLQRRCGNPRCHCAPGAKHPGAYLTWKLQAKTQTAYVPVDLLPEVRQGIQEYRRLKQLLGEMSQLTLALVKTHVQTRRRKPGRS